MRAVVASAGNLGSLVGRRFAKKYTQSELMTARLAAERKAKIAAGVDPDASDNEAALDLDKVHPAILGTSTVNLFEEPDDSEVALPPELKDIDMKDLKELDRTLAWRDDLFFRTTAEPEPFIRDIVLDRGLCVHFLHSLFTCVLTLLVSFLSAQHSGSEENQALRVMTELRQLETMRELTKLLTLLPHQYIIEEGRHQKMMPIGRMQTNSCLVVAGNGKGVAGWGFGKGEDASTAFAHAVLDVRKHLMFVPLLEGRTLFDDVVGKHKGVRMVCHIIAFSVFLLIFV